jgi:hypothetical protein
MRKQVESSEMAEPNAGILTCKKNGAVLSAKACKKQATKPRESAGTFMLVQNIFVQNERTAQV